MIRVVFWRGEDGNLSGFTVKGHAGFGPKGEDIVCAAVSALAQTAVLSLQEQVAAETEVSIGEGMLQCHLPASLSPAAQDKARVIMRTIELGLKAMAGDYKEYIAVEYKRI